MAARRSLEDLDLTAEEAAGLKAAFRDENFRRLFAEYAAELADPGQRAIYEAEVAALERQRGVDARFLHPTPGWVLRTSQAGARRCYLNVCSNALVGRPEARPEPGGSRWTLPHCLAPGREELSGRPGRPLRLVYDVVFHPDTLRLAARSARFRRMVDDTALDAVEKRFSPGLDRANAAPLRGAVKYKGVPQATLLRKPLPGGAPPPEPEDQGETALPPCPPSPYAYPPPEPETEAGPPQPTVAPPPATATTPRWTIRHRSYVDLQDYRHSRDSAPSPVPRELVVTVELPLLSSAAQAELEVREQELCLDSRRPTAAYALRLPLPYPVDESRGRATFNKALRQLVVTLPVVPKPAPSWPALHRQGDSQPEEETAPSSSPNELVSVSLQEPLQGGILPAIKGEQPSQEPSDTPPAPGASYVRESLVELPVCADKIGPASPVSPVIPSSSMEAPNLHSGTTSLHRPELPVCAEAVDPTFPGTPKVLVIAPDCNGDTDSRGSEVRACPSVSRSTKADFSEEREEDTGSLSLRPNLTSPALPPTHVCKMDLQKCPGSITSAVPPAGPSDSATASAHDLCEDTCLDCVACGNCSNLAQNPECPPSTEVAVYPSSRGQTDRSQPVACPSATSHAGLSPRSGTPDLPVLAKTALDTDANIPSLVSTGPGSPVSPICPAPAQCPPFHCTQDEEALTLLFQVPGVDLQSLKGEFSPDHYQVSFSDRDSLSYVFLLQLSSENKLVPPETRIDVSFSNAVIGLAKSPETAGLWTKLYFGLNKEALQERWFISEDNVDGFLSSRQRPSCSNPPDSDRQLSINVLHDVAEGKSMIRLKAREYNNSELGETEERVNPKREESELPTDDTDSPAVSDPRAAHAEQSARASGSLSSMETMGPSGQGAGCCLDKQDSSNPRLAPPGNGELELAFPTSQRATASQPARLEQKEPARPGAGEDMGSDSAKNTQGSYSQQVPPVLQETDMRDGSVQLISDHRTHCAITFQNPLLYDLD